jgi:hypothetical protein
MSEIYAIVDLQGYVSQMREAAANSLCDNYSDNLDSYISLNQMVGLVKSECVGFDDQDRPLLDEETNANIFDKTAVWIHNAGLAKLAADDLVECAWDDNSNEMIFWAKTKVSQDVPSTKPKTKRRNKKT